MAIKPNRKPMKFASGAKDKQQRNAIDDAIIAAMSDDSERALSFDDTQLMKEMIGRKESLAESMMSGESGKTISDADRKRATIRATSLLGMPTKKPRARPDVGAIERGNNSAKRTAQDLSSMEAGGLVGGQVKLDKNKDGKISGADFKMMEDGGEVKGKKRKKSKGNMCRGGGAALRGTSFSGVK
jgi:hypothetical protein